jgi:hypothetical protein
VEPGDPGEARESGNLPNHVQQCRALQKRLSCRCRSFLGGNRITVHQSPDSRDYHIEGVAELTLEADTAGRPETTGRMLLSLQEW